MKRKNRNKKMREENACDGSEKQKEKTASTTAEPQKKRVKLNL